MDERDRALGATARGGVDQLQAVDLEPEQGLGEVRDLEADVMEALALAREEAGDPGRVVGRLDELDLRLADREERDPDPVRWDVRDRLEPEAELVPPQPLRVLDRRHDQRNVVDLAEPADGRRDAIDGSGHLVPQIVISSRGTPNAVRSRSLISPTVAYALTASMIEGRRLSVPRAAASSRARAADQAAPSRS